MFKSLKKWAAVSMASVLLCGMLAPQTAFAEELEPEQEPVKTSVEISGLPEEAVNAGYEGSFTVTVTGVAEVLEGAYLEISGGMDACIVTPAKVENLVSGEAIEVKLKLEDYASGNVYISVDLCKETEDGTDYIESGSAEFECVGKMSSSMVFEPKTTVTAGTVYPFSVTLTNKSDTPVNNISMKVYSSTHVKEGWTKDMVVTGETKDGVSFADKTFTIATIPANSSITLNGTVTYPMSAVGDSSHLIAAAYVDGNLMTNVSSSDYATGDADYYFDIVAPANAGENDTEDNTDSQTETDTDAKERAPKTGDAAEIAGLMMLMLMAAGTIVVIRKREMR